MSRSEFEKSHPILWFFAQRILILDVWLTILKSFRRPSGEPGNSFHEELGTAQALVHSYDDDV